MIDLNELDYFDITLHEDEFEENIRNLRVDNLTYDELEYRYRSDTTSLPVAPLLKKEGDKLEKYILSSGPFNPYWNPNQYLYICYHFRCNGKSVRLECLPTDSESIECLLKEKGFCSLCNKYIHLKFFF